MPTSSFITSSGGPSRRGAAQPDEAPVCANSGCRNSALELRKSGNRYCARCVLEHVLYERDSRLQPGAPTV